MGGGQLGQMMIHAASGLGYPCWVYCPEQESPAAAVAERFFCADYSDKSTLTEFAAGVSVVTFEFENVPADAVSFLESITWVAPGSRCLSVAQDRALEKEFISGLGLQVAPYRVCDSRTSIEQAFGSLNAESILKTARGGYDGKGQWTIAAEADLQNIGEKRLTSKTVLEKKIQLKAEFSVVVVRAGSSQGDANSQPKTVCLGPFENTHRNHILFETRYPAALSDSLKSSAISSATRIADGLEYTGALCVEFFLSGQDELFVNEIAPRPHNSGHLSIEAFVCSQFEQHIRAVCGLPLGSDRSRSPAVMRNLLGDVWGDAEPNWSRLADFPEVKLHLYGKQAAREGRKMGHLTLLADDLQAASAQLDNAVAAIAAD